jgi:hypothetical protein
MTSHKFFSILVRTLMKYTFYMFVLMQFDAGFLLVFLFVLGCGMEMTYYDN